MRTYAGGNIDYNLLIALHRFGPLTGRAAAVVAVPEIGDYALQRLWFMRKHGLLDVVPYCGPRARAKKAKVAAINYLTGPGLRFLQGRGVTPRQAKTMRPRPEEYETIYRASMFLLSLYTKLPLRTINLMTVREFRAGLPLPRPVSARFVLNHDTAVYFPRDPSKVTRAGATWIADCVKKLSYCGIRHHLVIAADQAHRLDLVRAYTQQSLVNVHVILPHEVELVGEIGHALKPSALARLRDALGEMSVLPNLSAHEPTLTLMTATGSYYAADVSTYCVRHLCSIGSFDPDYALKRHRNDILIVVAHDEAGALDVAALFPDQLAHFRFVLLDVPFEESFRLVREKRLVVASVPRVEDVNGNLATASSLSTTRD